MDKKKVIIIAGAAILVIGIIVAILLFAIPEKNRESIELTFWGVFDDETVFNQLIEDFNEEYPRVRTTIKYKKIANQDYEGYLLDQMAAGTGPDIFMLHHTRLPSFKNKIIPAPAVPDLERDTPLPEEVQMSLNDYKSAFVDVAVADFVDESQIWGIPLYVDTLALYYNKDILNSYHIAQPPATWEQLIKDVETITEKDENADIVLSAAAIGSAHNVNRATDILSLMMMQSGADMINSKKTSATFNQDIGANDKVVNPGLEALRVYTNFASPAVSAYTWNPRLDYSIDMFYESKTAMMFNYSYHIPSIASLSPYLNYAIAPMPQFEKAEYETNYANYTGVTVSNHCLSVSTSRTDACNRAWEFLYWLGQNKNAKKYLELTKRPTARKDLVNWQKDDQELGVFATQSLTAKSWYQTDSSAIEGIMADMIESVVAREIDLIDALDRAAAQITVLMK